MKISVIIPTYKRAEMIVMSLESILKQDFPKDDYEVIVVDNNSPDNTESVVCNYIKDHEYSANIRYAKELRQGDVYARNTGAALAEGEYLYFTDDDALFDNNLLSCVSKILDLYPNVGMVGTRIVIKWDLQPDSWVRQYEYLLGADTYGESGYIIKSHGMCIPNGSLAVRKKLFFEVGGNNPGQIGEYLVGNAEVGLFHKIRDLGYPIAFTDDTTMWHVQKKAKNGNINDLVRRIENIAISDAYGDVIEKGKVVPREVNRYKLSFIKNTLFFRRTKSRRAYFTYKANKKYNEWIKKYSDKDFINKICKADYILDQNYECPKIIYRTDYAATQINTTS